MRLGVVGGQLLKTLAHGGAVARQLLTILRLGVAVILLTGCYVTRQAWHQGRLLTSRRPVQEVIGDTTTSAETRKKLSKLQDILAYAGRQRLNVDGAYDYFIQTQQPVVSYLVQAAPADKLELVTWWFPIVGRVPYLGYFDKDERDAEAKRLASNGLDVELGGAGAFSSLGWFNDPVFSSMLLRRDSELAHLFFHELTHRTVWVPNAATFNENLAEYVAVVLTRQYLQELSDPSALEAYELRRRDKELFADWLTALKAELQTLYENSTLSREAKLANKEKVLSEFQKSPKKPNFKQVDFVGSEIWNNASIMSAALYSPDFESFDRLRKCLGDPALRDFLDTIGKQLRDHDGDPMTIAFALCTKRSEKEKPSVD